MPAEQLNPDRDLREYGVESIVRLKLIRGLERDLRVKTSARELLAHHTINAVSACLADRAGTVIPVTPDALDLFRSGALDLSAVEALLDEGAAL